MKLNEIINKAILICNLLCVTAYAMAQEAHRFSYIHPKPSSAMVSGATNIILRHNSKVHPASVQRELIHVEGSLSGVHSGELLLSDDHRTLVFNPDKAFSPG